MSAAPWLEEPRAGGASPVAGETPAAAGGRFRTIPVGVSRNRTPIEAVLVGPSEEPSLRILVVAGQHGDEPWGREAVRAWIAGSDGAPNEELRVPLGLAAIADANPDGSRAATRANAAGIDLNRDHLLLSQPETHALHRFVRWYRPHLIVDVHNYPPRRRALLARDWVLDTDVQLATPTHPAIRTALPPSAWAGLVSHVRTGVSEAGFSFARYSLPRRDGRVRPSTLHTRDARNTLALRYGIPTVLLEGRDPGRLGSQDETGRTILAQLTALRAIQEWAVREAEPLVRGPPLPHPEESVPIRAGWADGGEAPLVRVRHPSTGESEWVGWPHYHGTVRIDGAVPLPRAYAVHSVFGSWTIAQLDRHGFESEPAGEGQYALAEEPGGSGASHSVDLAGYRIYSVHQRGGRALAVWLESGSGDAIASADAPASLPSSATDAPTTLRILRWGYAPAAPERPLIAPSVDRLTDEEGVGAWTWA